MPPQPLAPSGPSSLDPQAVMLAKAIRQSESGGNPTAKGKSGEYGAYQYTNDTWLKDAATAGVTTPLSQASLEDQNKVAYTKIKGLKDQGMNVGQIASIWNSGKPDAYLDPAYKGVNKHGASYDVPAYARSVAEAYQKLKAGQQVGIDPNNPSSTANTTPVQPPEQKDGFLKSVAKSIVEPVATMVARPIQLGAELLGASAEDVNKATKDIAGDWVAPVPQNFQDVAKDVGRGAQTVALGMPVGSVGKAAAMGTVAGAGAGLEQTGTLEGAAKQGAVGAGFGVAGGLAAKALSAAPKWLAGQAFSGLDDAQISKVLAEKSMGSASHLLKQSQKSVATYGNQVDDILKATTSTGGGDFSVRATTTQFPEFVGKEARMLQKIKSLVPAGYDVGFTGRGWDRATIVGYIDKIANGTATLWEKNRVRSVIDGATAGGYAKLARSLNPSAGHDLAMTFASALRNEVQESAPATIPIFEEFAKEMAIQKAIKALTKGTGRGLIQWRDIVPFMVGNAAGPLGGLGAVAVNRAASSPVAAFNLARGLQGVNKVVNPVLGRAGLVGLNK